MSLLNVFRALGLAQVPERDLSTTGFLQPVLEVGGLEWARAAERLYGYGQALGVGDTAAADLGAVVIQRAQEGRYQASVQGSGNTGANVKLGLVVQPFGGGVDRRFIWESADNQYPRGAALLPPIYLREGDTVYCRVRNFAGGAVNLEGWLVLHPCP